jgi:hypothetical protein
VSAVDSNMPDDTVSAADSPFSGAFAYHPPFDFAWADDVEAEGEEWLVNGLIPKRSYVLIYGRRGAAKTFFGIEIAMQGGVAGGRLLGQGIPERFGTIIFVGEKRGRFGKRIKAWLTAMKAKGVPVMVVWSVPDLTDPISVEETIAFILSVKPDFAARGAPLGLIILDTLVRAIGGKSDIDQEVAGRATGAVQSIIEKCDVAVAPIHHMAKSDMATTARGSGIWEDAADAVVRLDREDKSQVRTVSLTKQSDDDDRLEFAFELDLVALGISKFGRRITSCVIRQVGHEAGERKVPRKISPKLHLVMRCVEQCREAGQTEIVPSTDGIPPGTKGVLRSALHDRLGNEGYTTDAGTPASIKKAINRHINDLIGMKRLRGTQRLVWAV